MCFGDYRGPDDAKIFLKYAAARLNENLEAAAFRSYMADALWLIGQGKSWSERWSVDTKKKKEPESADADPEKIKNRIVRGLKGLAKS